MTVRVRTPVFVFLSCILFAAVLQGKGEPRNEPVGPMMVNPSMVQWNVIPDHESVDLTVLGPDGDVFSASFKGGPPSFKLNDLRGKDSFDGTYIYELRIVPRISPEVKQALKDARANGDDEKARQIQKQAGIDRIITQSGAFSILHGAFVSPDLDEGTTGGASLKPGAQAAPASGEGGGNGNTQTRSTPHLTPAPNDQVIADDLIVQGSECIGLDCVNNESFGFDTLRLKENNTRIKFDDTSTSPGFPNVNWQLTANDSASGGANKFSIEDITDSKVPFTVMANAPTSSVFVDSSGKVGIGTSTPVLNIHENKSDTPGIRLEQNSSGGFTAQTWDIAGNEANFFVRDVTGGSRLPFRIRPGAPTSSIDISASGNVGIGTASPAGKLHVATSGGDVVVTTAGKVGIGRVPAANIRLHVAGVDHGATNYLFAAQDDLNNNALYVRDDGFIYFGHGATESMRIDTSGNVGIGTPSPASRLHVSGGDIRVTGGSFIDDGVTLTAPDYVFDSSYKLMPIQKLADFVRTEKHLPNVPDAKSIKADGLNMSQFQMRLLEKVEELTLYTIDLKAQNDELQKRLDAIEKQIRQQ